MSINEVRYLPECGSTNAYVKEHFEEFGPVGAVYTENQTAGRGRLGRSWVNAEGKALYYTVAIREPLAQPATLPLLASLAVRTQLKLRYGVDCQIKWPNDLLLNGKKIVGILCEGVSYGYQRRAGAYSQKGKVSNLKEMNETFNYLRANGIYSLEDLEHRVSEHSAATESLKKTLDEQTARMKAIKQLYDSSAAFQNLKPVYDGLQKIKFEKPRAKYKAEHETELKQFYAARRKLTGEFPDGKVDMKKLTEEYDELEQAHNTTYGEFKTVRDDLHRLWKVKSCVDTAARFNERTEEQMLQNRPQTRQKKEDMTR